MAQILSNGAAIRAIRERSEMSVEELASAVRAEGIRVHRDSLYSIELGLRNAGPKLLGAIARALKVSKIAIMNNPTDPS